MTESNQAPSISVLPDGCISEILSRTSPRDACRASSISKMFNLASNSDAVWERFLPPDYRQIIARAVSPVAFESKKQLYHRLSDSHILLNRGYLGFKLDKESGRKCYMLGARDLSIAWGNDTKYWKWEHIPESRFEEVAILRYVWWLGIHGKIASVMLSPKTLYAAYLVYRITSDSSGLRNPAKTTVIFREVRNETSNVFLQHPRRRRLRNDGWMEIELGEFYCENGDEDEVVMGFDEHDDHKTKEGLIVEGIEIRPK